MRAVPLDFLRFPEKEREENELSIYEHTKNVFLLLLFILDDGNSCKVTQMVAVYSNSSSTFHKKNFFLPFFKEWAWNKKLKMENL